MSNAIVGLAASRAESRGGQDSGGREPEPHYFIMVSVLANGCCVTYSGVCGNRLGDRRMTCG